MLQEPTATERQPSPARKRVAPVAANPVIEPRALRHDILNSLTVALGYAGLMHRWLSPASDPRLLRAVKAIEDDVRRAHRLLLQNGIGASDDRDLHAVIGRAVSQIPALRADDLRLRFRTSEPLVGAWDPLQIEQALANLIDNAAKYSAAGSPIEIEVTAEDGKARVAVRDAGIGIAADDLDAVFTGDGWRTVEARAIATGAGIGLSLCRQLVATADGRLEARSIPGVGSEFTIVLPLSHPVGTPFAATASRDGTHSASR